MANGPDLRRAVDRSLGDTTAVLPVGGKRSGMSRKVLTTFGVEVGLPARAVDSTIEHVLSATPGIGDELAAGVLPFGQRRQHDLIRTHRRRRRELTG